MKKFIKCGVILALMCKMSDSLAVNTIQTNPGPGGSTQFSGTIDKQTKQTLHNTAKDLNKTVESMGKNMEMQKKNMQVSPSSSNNVNPKGSTNPTTSGSSMNNSVK